MKAKPNVLVPGMLLAALLNGFGQPIITNQPQWQTNAVGSTAMLTVGATGAPPLSYQWRFNGTTNAGATNATLVLPNVQTTNQGNYSVRVEEFGGLSVTSAVARLYVIVPPSITAQPTNFPSVSVGASVSNRVVASGSTSLHYQWLRDGINLFAQTNATLVLTNLQLADTGDYTVVVTNLAGSTNSQVARLSVDPTFTKITTGSIVTDVATSLGCSWGDFDNDGFLDMFVANSTYPGVPWGRNFLYHNNRDGTFTAITSGSIVTEVGDHPAGIWGDYDNDGFLDLFITHGSVVQGSRLANFLYRNNGNGTFSKVTNGNVATDLGNARGCAWGDFDNDGKLDLYVSNAYFITNFLYRNRGDLTFTRVTAGSIATELADSRGCSWGDYDNDGYLDLFVANGGRTSTQNNFLYHNNGDGNLTKVTSGSIVNDGGHSFGCTWGDYDNDGFLDLFVANDGKENNFLYHNNGDGSFTKITNGSPVNDGGESIGCAWGDYDHDGFLDLFVGNGGNTLSGNDENQRNFLYRNNGNGNNWLAIKLVGTASNRSAIGSKVRVSALMGGTNRWQLREISGGDAIGGQNGLHAHFGLGDATNIDTVRIEWPSGTVQQLHDVAVKQFLTVTEPPRLSSPHITNGMFGFTLKGGRGFQYDIQTSSNLLDWVSVGSVTVTNFTGTTLFAETLHANAQSRFYRAVSP
ncbi:MAG TPA: FG-GAP-like repeat-containing protein [Verrucomicrobiae bacterium]|nr:FG-GAP-like repeat-containing protein [Verrucomicrobiae bacterium]